MIASETPSIATAAMRAMPGSSDGEGGWHPIAPALCRAALCVAPKRVVRAQPGCTASQPAAALAVPPRLLECGVRRAARGVLRGRSPQRSQPRA